jgi:hypothetical protein
LPRSRSSRLGPQKAHPNEIADRFLVVWLPCLYLQALCASTPGALPAYAAALSRTTRDSLPAPDEAVGHLRIWIVCLVRACPRVDVALALYTNGLGGEFELHVNLLRTAADWQVFDVAEAPPHVAPPSPLDRSPRGC